MEALVIILSILGVGALVAGFILLYVFVISRLRMKQQIKDLEKKYSYLDALLIGQDTQYIHRLEMISRSNLLYVEKHELFQKRFKEIYENDDKFMESILRRLRALVENKQYKSLKKAIVDAKKFMGTFEEKVTNLDNDLFALIKPEEDTRHAILKLKDNYRRLKQIFYSNSSDLDLVASSFVKVFDKLDASFAEFENMIECADYDSANNMIPNIQKVISAIENALIELPNLCILTISVVPQKIEELKANFEEIEKQGLPLYNITFKTKYENWNTILEKIKIKLINLQTAGISDILNKIMEEIADTQSQLDKEVADKEFFTNNIDEVYGDAIELEKSFLKICSILPNVRSVYKIEEQQEQEIEQLKVIMEHLGATKRSLDNYVHSNTRQPFSTLRGKLDELKVSYEEALKGITDFKAYLESIKNASEEAYYLVFVYFYRCKQIESLLREMSILNLSAAYQDKIDTTYNLINDIDKAIKLRPIDVAAINEMVEQLKNTANTLFDDIEEKAREMKLAESAVVYANRDRNHQSDVNQALLELENSFFEGDFDKVYRDATVIYRRNHVEEVEDAR